MHIACVTMSSATPGFFEAGNVEFQAGGIRQPMQVATTNFGFVSLSSNSRLTVHATKTQPWLALFAFDGVEECHERILVEYRAAAAHDRFCAVIHARIVAEMLRFTVTVRSNGLRRYPHVGARVSYAAMEVVN